MFKLARLMFLLVHRNIEAWRRTPVATEAGKREARRAVMGAMASKGWNPATLAEHAGIDYGTAGDFLNGKRWAKHATLAKIEQALGWTPGTLAAIGDELGEAPEAVSADGQDDGALLYRAPDGVTGPEWERIKREAQEFIEWQVSRAARER
ncbi:helix-turn-helix domain-containing protein [Propionibacteriaceae bacterium Y1700]|uniref:helix-turn-helix domain-containing protein n=1 Tax=Microlunatus sp. Y1700 TaxID=3418487 RepID=UPI003DA6F2C9